MPWVTVVLSHELIARRALRKQHSQGSFQVLQSVLGTAPFNPVWSLARHGWTAFAYMPKLFRDYAYSQ